MKRINQKTAYNIVLAKCGVKCKVELLEKYSAEYFSVHDIFVI